MSETLNRYREAVADLRRAASAVLPAEQVTIYFGPLDMLGTLVGDLQARLDDLEARQ